MNPSCSRASQLGTSYLARDHSHAKCFAGASYVCWLIDHHFSLYMHPTSGILHTVIIHKGSYTKNIKKLFGKIFSIHGVSGVTVSEM